MEKSGKKVTIYDVAKAANVTIATVSRVINGKNVVSPETRERVLKVIEELNYYPSPLASGLSGKRTGEIGVISPIFFGSFYFGIFEGIVNEIKDYDVIIYNVSNPEDKKKVIAKVCNENKLDGLLIISLPITLEDEILLKKCKMPLVIIDNKHVEFSNVYFDNKIGAFTAVNHLIELGHKKIAIITGALEDPFHLTVAKDRLAGYNMALNLAKIDVKENYIAINDWSKEGAYKLTKKLLSMKDRPTAIFAVSDLQAIGVLEAARDMNIKVPEELSVIGYDNFFWSEFLSLTTVYQPLKIIAQIGVKMLLDQIENNIAKKESIVIQPELIIRKTTCPPKNK